MKLSDFQKTFKHHINKGLSYFGTAKLRQRTNFDFDVFLPTKGLNLQRDLCWTVEQKQALIMSMLKNMHIDPIVVVQMDRGTDKYEWQVIDGKQRLTTAFAYIDGEFPLNVGGIDYYFNDLPTDCQRQIAWFDFKWDIHYSYPDDPISDQTKIDLFESVNFLGTPVDIAHLNKLKKT